MFIKFANRMRSSASVVILLIGVVFACVALADEKVKPEQCNGPPPIDHRMNPDTCCKKPIFKAELRDCLNKTRQIMIKRFHEARDEKTEDQTETPGTTTTDEGCLAKCFSGKDIFQNDEINRDELVKVLEAQTEDSAWKSIHSDAVDKCITVLQPDLKDIETAKPGQQCNRVAVLMTICLNGQYFTRCPATHFQNDNENCKKFQEHIKACPMPGGPWGRGNGKKHFGGGKGGNFKSDFGDSESNHGRPFGGHGHFGPGHFGPGHFGPGHFGRFGAGMGPNFATGDVFGFL